MNCISCEFSNWENVFTYEFVFADGRWNPVGPDGSVRRHKVTGHNWAWSWQSWPRSHIDVAQPPSTSARCAGQFDAKLWQQYVGNIQNGAIVSSTVYRLPKGESAATTIIMRFAIKLPFSRFLWFRSQYFNSEELMIAHRLIRHSSNSNNSATFGSGKNNGAVSDKTFECDVCLKTFNKHSSWWKHKKCHTGERAYKCFTCEKSFTQQANLHRHMTVHTGEKPHQ